MTTTLEIAEQLDGQQYPLDRGAEVKRIFEAAKEAGIVIVFGASDDLIEFRGAIEDEAGCYDGGTVFFDRDGVLPINEDLTLQDDEPRNVEECRRIVKRFDEAIKMKAIWGKDEISWQYELDQDHIIFDVLEDDDIYCKGIVFKLQP